MKVSTRVQDITDDRGKKYGHPYDHFGRTIGVLNALGFRRTLDDGSTRELVRTDWPHIMISDKLARAYESPEYQDHRDDVAGYAWTWDAVIQRGTELAGIPLEEEIPF